MSCNRAIRSLVPAVLLLTLACAPASAPSPTAAPAKPASAAAATTVPAAKSAAPAPTAAPAAKPAAPPPTTAAGPPAKPAPSPSTSNAEFQRLLQAARNETGLAIWVSDPRQEATQNALVQAFKERFGLQQLKVDWLPIHPVDASQRLRTEAQGGQHTADVLSGSIGQLTPAVDAGLVAKVDWAGVFGSELPGIGEAAGRMIEDWAGLGVVQWDVAYVMTYNTDQVKADDVPANVESFADPKWRGRFALNSAGAAPFDTMAIEWGKDKTLELMRQLVDNQPVYKNGTPGVIVGVGQGEAAAGSGTPNQTLLEKDKGAPIDWKPMTYVPVLPLYFYIPKNAPHPNAARLFTAWAATEGMKIQEEREYLGRVTDPNSFISKEIKRTAPNAKVTQARNLRDVALSAEVADAIIKLRSGGG
jgi:ABC-type Fe3+ transport system substrate-binding protein